jgi:pullulanase/glycogen debranching enzyme
MYFDNILLRQYLDSELKVKVYSDESRQWYYLTIDSFDSVPEGQVVGFDITGRGHTLDWKTFTQVKVGESVLDIDGLNKLAHPEEAPEKEEDKPNKEDDKEDESKKDDSKSLPPAPKDKDEPEKKESLKRGDTTIYEGKPAYVDSVSDKYIHLKVWIDGLYVYRAIEK